MTDRGVDETQALLVGIRILEFDGELYLAEAEIGQYVDDLSALGVTLVFHPLSDIDPTSGEDDGNRPVYRFDFDDELIRDERAPLRDQAQNILRQLRSLPESELGHLLQVAKEED